MFAGSTAKLAQVPLRTPQKVKATVANIPVGSYEGGGRGKDRERERERDKEREKERERESTGLPPHFSFEPDSPATHSTDESASSERPPESSSTAHPCEGRNSTATKEASEQCPTAQLLCLQSREETLLTH